MKVLITFDIILIGLLQPHLIVGTEEACQYVDVQDDPVFAGWLMTDLSHYMVQLRANGNCSQLGPVVKS